MLPAGKGTHTDQVSAVLQDLRAEVFSLWLDNDSTKI